MPRSRLLTFAASLFLVAGLSACGGEDGNGGTATTTTVSPTNGGESPTGGETTDGGGAAADALPDDLAEAGVIRVASDIAYPPIEFVDENGDPAGLDIDLANAMGEVLGVEFEFTNQTFDGIIAALQAGRFDIAMSAMTDNAERQEVVDFVDYFSAGTSIAVRSGNPHGVAGLEDLCGLRVAIQRGTVQVGQAEAQNEQCDEPMEILQYDDQTAANLAMQSDQADATLADSPVNAWSVRESDGAFEVVEGALYETAPYGIVVPKGNDDLVEALRLAMEELLENGTYQEILDKWELGDGALDEITVNAGT